MDQTRSRELFRASISEYLLIEGSQSMGWPNHRLGTLIVALALPFAIQLPLAILGWYVPWMPWVFSLSSVLLSAVLGFVFLARRFRRSAVLIGVLYFPVVIPALMYFSLLVVGYVFNDHI